MPNFRERMRDLVSGDFRGYQRALIGLEAGDFLTKAYMTFKENPEDDDPGVFQKVITGANDPTHGQITDSGASSGTAVVYFRLLPTDTILLVPDTTYSYDVQIHLSSGNAPITVIKGTVTTLQGVTAATA